MNANMLKFSRFLAVLLVLGMAFSVAPSSSVLAQGLSSDVNPTSDLVPTFADVPSSHWAYQYVETFYAAGMTTGCATEPFRYCPERLVTRAETAVFFLRSINGGSYQPPVASGTFADVPVAGKDWMEPWIEEFFAEGLTTGCSADPLGYCPERTVTRAELAVFALRAKYGQDYQPPAVIESSFSDVPVSGKAWMMPWIEEFYQEGLTTGCYQTPTLQYCPERGVTRAEMATFLVRTFNIGASQPVISNMHFASNSAKGSTVARNGDVITLTFTADMRVYKLSNFKINGSNPDTFTNIGNVYTATHLVDSGDLITGFPATFQINVKNDAGIYSTTVEATTDGSSVTIVDEKPVISAIHFGSNNVHPEMATYGDILTLTFTSDEPVEKLSNFKINGSNPDTFTHVDNVYTATHLVDVGDLITASPATFQINVKNAMGIYSITVEATTDGSSVMIYKMPIITNVSIASNNADQTIAKNGDIIALTFTADESVTKLSNFKINGSNPDTFTNVGLVYTATHLVDEGDPITGSPATFQINVKNAMGIYSLTVEATNDSSSVTIYSTQNVIAQDFGVMNFSNVTGYSVGFRLVDAVASDASQVVINLYKGTSLLAAATSTGVLTNYPTLSSLSAPFNILGSFDYAADGNWDYSGWLGNASDIPDKAEITVTFKNGLVKTAINTNLSGDTSLFNLVISDIHISSDNPIQTEAKLGDIISLTFTANQQVTKLSNFKINGSNPDSFTNFGNVYTATHLVDGGDPITGAPATFQINVKNDVGVYSQTLEDTTDGSSVTIVESIGAIDYFSGLDFARTFDPSSTSSGTRSVEQVVNPDGSVTISVTSADNEYVDSGLIMSIGTLGELDSITVKGTGDFSFNLYFDIDKDGEFFLWNPDGTFNGLGSDRYALFEGPYGPTLFANGSSNFGLIGGSPYVNTLDQLKAMFPSDTPVGIWIGVTRGGEPAGTKTATISSVTVTKVP